MKLALFILALVIVAGGFAIFIEVQTSAKTVYADDDSSHPLSDITDEEFYEIQAEIARLEAEAAKLIEEGQSTNEEKQGVEE
ncbi:hypothetical protein [Methylophaga frappieri]|nr:hypothetical protein [Methylophaga frappieri]